ncbi:MAG: hypothetical protein AMXMBFR74_29940 [Parvibaculum sp.]|uniref:hypothetical protein n=1 Tax=Parvibaculum sp. TaxID=2024848 RepID=UPI0035B9D7BE
MNPKLSELRKVDSPPTAINWVRFNDTDVLKTARQITQFALRPPRWSYRPANSAAHDRIVYGLDRETAKKMGATKGNPQGRPHNVSLIEAFFDRDLERQYAGRPVYSEGMTEYFKLNQQLWVPVKPLVVTAEHGKLLPIFMCGWSDLNLTLFQRRLYMTIVEDALMSLTDFQTSQAEFLFFPKIAAGGERRRTTEVWHRGDYELLSQSDLQDQVAIYLEARELARVAVIDELRKRAPKDTGVAEDNVRPTPNGQARELFD